MIKTCAILFVFLIVLPASVSAEEVDERIPALILKVEGSAVVRKKSRIEESAGVGGKIYAGDTVVTDEKSTVQLMTVDGSVVKVGFSSRFLLEEVSLLDRAVAWSFNLLKGQVRALVVPKPDNQIRFKIKTPTAAMGIRGTEFVLVYNEEADSSYLYTLEGLVEYGPTDCEKTKSCVDVRAGETSLVKKGTPATRPAPFQLKDLLVRGGKKIDSAGRLSLFVNADKAEVGTVGAPGSVENESSLKAMVEKSSEELADGQDRALGRTRAERDKVNEAIKAGTFRSIMDKADGYSRARLSDRVGDIGGADEIVGASAMAKFRLGEAVSRAEKEQLFTPGKSGEAPAYEVKRTVPYGQEKKLKELAPALETTGASYAGVMERSLPPGQLKKLISTSTPSPVSRGSETQNTRAVNLNVNVKTNNGNSNGNSGKKSIVVSSCTGSCVTAAAAKIVVATAEKTVASFNGEKVTEIPAKGKDAVVETPAPKADPKKLKECFQTVEDCKLELCSGFEKGAPCKKGTSKKVCTSKKVLTKCK